MELTTGDVSFTFRLNEAGQRHVAPIDLIEWEPFRSTNTVPGREGQHVLLECAMIFDEREEEEKLADRQTYLPALEYFLKHRVAITDAVMAASVTFAQDLYKVSVKYGVDRVELAQVATIDDLKTMIDLSYVQLFPYHQNGLPYIGYRFESNWDEYGFYALLLGTEVLACGFSGTALAIDRSIRDDGGVI
jgi:hypothetical protein